METFVYSLKPTGNVCFLQLLSKKFNLESNKIKDFFPSLGLPRTCSNAGSISLGLGKLASEEFRKGFGDCSVQNAQSMQGMQNIVFFFTLTVYICLNNLYLFFSWRLTFVS